MLTETEAVQTKTIDICSTDSSCEKSSTPVKTQPQKSATKDLPPSVVPVSLSPSVPEKKGEPSGTLQSVPKEVAEVADPAITNTVGETSSSSAPSAVVKATSQTSSGPSMYTEAQISSNLPTQILTKKVCEIVSPLDVIRSPSDFIVRLADSVSPKTE